MKRMLLIVLLFALPLCTAAAATAAPRGETSLALKAGGIGFTDSAARDLDVDRGAYLGLEAFTRLSDRLHLGGEVGYARAEGSIPLVETELTYIPVELNLKYSFEKTPTLAYTLGGGLSYSFVQLELDCLGACFAEDEDWLAGAQIFGGLNFSLRGYFFGVEGKYQVSEEDLDNWRLTGQAGFEF